jgi:hypothetical protein
VTPVDRGILELKTAVSNLHAQVDSLHKKIDEYVLEKYFVESRLNVICHV